MPAAASAEFGEGGSWGSCGGLREGLLVGDFISACTTVGEVGASVVEVVLWDLEGHFFWMNDIFGCEGVRDRVALRLELAMVLIVTYLHWLDVGWFGHESCVCLEVVLDWEDVATRHRGSIVGHLVSICIQNALFLYLWSFLTLKSFTLSIPTNLPNSTAISMGIPWSKRSWFNASTTWSSFFMSTLHTPILFLKIGKFLRLV